MKLWCQANCIYQYKKVCINSDVQHVRGISIDKKGRCKNYIKKMIGKGDKK